MREYGSGSSGRTSKMFGPKVRSLLTIGSLFSVSSEAATNFVFAFWLYRLQILFEESKYKIYLHIIYMILT